MVSGGSDATRLRLPLTVATSKLSFHQRLDGYEDVGASPWHDSSYGEYDHEVGCGKTGIIVDGKHIRIFCEKEPANLPWDELGVDVVRIDGFLCRPTRLGRTSTQPVQSHHQRTCQGEGADYRTRCQR